jgi:hypothetical protein
MSERNDSLRVNLIATEGNTEKALELTLQYRKSKEEITDRNTDD